MARALIELDLVVTSKDGDTLGTCPVSIPLNVVATSGVHAVTLNADTADLTTRLTAGFEAFKAAVEK